MKTHKIGVMGGDGTGPEVTVEAVKVMEAAAAKFGFKVEQTEYDFGGERYMKTGEILPDGAVDELKKQDKDKGPKEIDYVVVRENSGDIYTGSGGLMMKDTPHEVATQTAVYTRFQVDRALKYAFEYAKKHGKKARGVGEENTVALVGKTNVLTFVYDLWERAFHEMGKKDYPDIRRDYYHVDATCMWMVKSPEWFDVLVTGNLFGDIITDLGAMTQGGMGIAAGGNINPEGVSMFEPIGGSAPKYTGMGVINPLAAICAMQMMLETLGEEDAAKKIDEAVRYVTANKIKSLAAKKMGYTTSQVGDMVAQLVAD
ncbi:MAG: isocitrate/isopropylmalate family dehydrogenase [Planctomycetota bacterium]|jgi:3-isopropylmalate dehydrogenase